MPKDHTRQRPIAIRMILLSMRRPIAEIGRQWSHAGTRHFSTTDQEAASSLGIWGSPPRASDTRFNLGSPMTFGGSSQDQLGEERCDLATLHIERESSQWVTCDHTHIERASSQWVTCDHTYRESVIPMGYVREHHPNGVHVLIKC